MKAAYTLFERNSALLLASEDWAKGYNQAPVQHAKLIKAMARLERKLLVFFKQMATVAPQQWVNWHAYLMAVQQVKASKVDAYDINVIVNNDAIDNTNSDFVTLVFEDILLATTLGAAAGNTTYGITTNLSAADSSIQRQARKQVSQLVGKRVLDDGSVVDNPNSDYVISNTTRKQIQDAIHTSIMLGEDVPSAAARIQKIIKDPARAKLIAHQELANAYTTGLHMYGEASGAVGKQWLDNGAIDICKDNTAAGPIPFDQPYPSGVQHPTAHIGCRCYERLIYQNELIKNPHMLD